MKIVLFILLLIGRNGIGRHSMFCFSTSYHIETWKNGTYELIGSHEQGNPYGLDCGSGKKYKNCCGRNA